VVGDTLEKLLDRSDRVRSIDLARHLIATGQNDEEASSAFRDILLEEPGNREALKTLAELHERRGDVSEAVALLSDSLREAETRGDADWQAETSRHLGDLLAKPIPARPNKCIDSAGFQHP
jgi:Flp pilus assembly protein TadD